MRPVRGRRPFHTRPHDTAEDDLRHHGGTDARSPSPRDRRQGVQVVFGDFKPQFLSHARIIHSRARTMGNLFRFHYTSFWSFTIF